MLGCFRVQFYSMIQSR